MKKKVVKVWGPATVANWGPGFDLLGASVSKLGDVVTAEWIPDGEEGVEIVQIEGDEGKLPRRAEENTAGIAAIEAKKALQLPGLLKLSIRKGLPLGSGLGSSSASAAAGAYAVNLLAGNPLSREELIPFAVEAEAAVSGRHADNVAPALLGGFVLVYQMDPLRIVKLPVNFEANLVLVTPEMSIPTKMARELIPEEIPLARAVENGGRLAAMIAALYSGDLEQFAHSLRDEVVEPARAKLIPGFQEAKEAALGAGALAFAISGAGPTLMALTNPSANCDMIGQKIVHALRQKGVNASFTVTTIDSTGTREVTPDEPV